MIGKQNLTWSSRAIGTNEARVLQKYNFKRRLNTCGINSLSLSRVITTLERVQSAIESYTLAI